MAKLPKETQDALNSFDWAEEAEDIGKQYSLNDADINNFQVETFSFLIGLTNLEKYTENVEKDLGITKEKAQDIIDSVSLNILLPIMEQIPRYKDVVKLPPKPAKEYSGVFSKLSDGASTQMASQFRAELKQNILANQKEGQKDFLANLGKVISESTKKES